MKIEELTWDSSFFGFPVGKLRVDESVSDTRRLQEVLASAPFRVLYVMLEDPSSADLEALKSIVPMIDMKREYAKELGPDESIPAGIRTYRNGLTDELLELALMSGHLSRFRMDPRFAPDFTRLYTKWVERALDEQTSEVALVEERNARLSGFVTVSNGNPGRIGLLAVHPDFQGMGVGSRLLQGAGQWCSRQGCPEIRVATQGSNLAAKMLYEENGYQLVRETAIFHWWNTVSESP